jgi:ribosomal protein L11 methyltransferase
MNFACLQIAGCSSNQADILTALLPNDVLLGTEINDHEALFYFHEADCPVESIEESLLQLGLTGTWQEIPLQNWNAQWESNFDPIRIHDELGIRAEFHPPFTDVTYDVVITPKMSFGTGHHETTRLMAEYLQEIPCAKQSVFDFGTGTGILAIYAAKRGASRILGTDNDAWSMENGRENCDRNDCSHITISNTPCSEIAGSFNIIIANINLNVLLDHAAELYRLLDKDGDLLLSGVLTTDENQLSTAFESLGFEKISTKARKNWLALHFRKARH